MNKLRSNIQERIDPRSIYFQFLATAQPDSNSGGTGASEQQGRGKPRILGTKGKVGKHVLGTVAVPTGDYAKQYFGSPALSGAQGANLATARTPLVNGATSSSAAHWQQPVLRIDGQNYGATDEFYDDSSRSSTGSNYGVFGGAPGGSNSASAPARW